VVTAWSSFITASAVKPIIVMQRRGCQRRQGAVSHMIHRSILATDVVAVKPNLELEASVAATTATFATH
jgi:hypothetical protein